MPGACWLAWGEPGDVQQQALDVYPQAPDVQLIHVQCLFGCPASVSVHVGFAENLRMLGTSSRHIHMPSQHASVHPQVLTGHAALAWYCAVLALAALS